MRARRTILFRLSVLVLAAILIMGVVSIAVTFYSPPPFRPPVQTADVLAVLDQPGTAVGTGMRDVRITGARALPPPGAGERCDAAASAALALRLRLTEGDVRLCTSAFAREPRTAGGIPSELRERFSLAVRSGDGWRIARLPPPPLITRWHVATFGWLVLAGSILFGACLFVVRSIARPLQQLAADARQAGIDGPAFRPDPAAPVEVRQLAAAITGMRRRHAALVTNRAELLVGIAHDLGTPLTRLAFRIEALPEPARANAHADIAEMRQLIAAALEFARGRDRSIEPVALDMLVADRVASLDKNEAPVQILATEPLVVTANPVDLMRVVDNLIVNAQRHGGGAEISLRRAGDIAEMAVRDHGPGIDPAFASRLFEPLHRGANPDLEPRTGIGHGLGLAIVQSNVESLGGVIEAANAPTGGAVFTVRLPLII